MYSLFRESGRAANEGIKGITLNIKYKYAVDEVETGVEETFLGDSRLALMCMLLAMRIMGGDAVSRFQFYPVGTGCMAPHVDMLTLKDLNRYVITLMDEDDGEGE
mmetsp:Transcript_83655/g.236119  ORF Transcript_83655/g.236119 Transcript_83655/m.236119 type:complete len:105 (-) Transcript_83655:453-767(-)